MALTALATKIRDFECESHVNAEQRVPQLENWLAWPQFRHAPWGYGYENSCLRVIRLDKDEESRLGIVASTVWERLGARVLDANAWRRRSSMRHIAHC